MEGGDNDCISTRSDSLRRASLFELLSPPPLAGQTKAPWSDLEGENICQEEIELRVIQSFGDCSLATHTSTGLYHQDSMWREEKRAPA